MNKKSLIVCLLMSCLLATPASRAQVADTMTVPFGCFEQWNSFAGDTMSLMGLPIPINGGYTLPDGWDIPRYNINDTVTYMGLSIPINTSIPLAKVSRDSVNAPEGGSALVAESCVSGCVGPHGLFAGFFAAGFELGERGVANCHLDRHCEY